MQVRGFEMSQRLGKDLMMYCETQVYCSDALVNIDWLGAGNLGESHRS